jgi:hypothetical protein
MASPSSLNWTCQSSTFVVNNKYFTKRLMRRKEQIAAYAPSIVFAPLMMNPKYPSYTAAPDTMIYKGYTQSLPNDAPLSATSVDRDCNTELNYNLISKVFYPKEINIPAGSIDLNKRSGSVASPWSQRLYSSNATNGYGYPLNFGSGSSGAVSTDACITRFGLQDFVGASLSNYTALSDVLYCQKSKKFCSFAKTGAGLDFTPPWDSENRDNWKNSANSLNVSPYVSFANNTATLPNLDRIGAPIIYTEKDATKNYLPGSAQDMYSLSAADNGTNYFSLAMGIPLNCSGNGCVTDGKANDDMTFALNPKSPSSLVTTPLSNTYYYPWFYFITGTSPSTGIVYNTSWNDEFLVHLSVGWQGTNHPGGDWDNGQGTGKFKRYGLWLWDGSELNFTGRCSQLVESYSK